MKVRRLHELERGTSCSEGARALRKSRAVLFRTKADKDIVCAMSAILRFTEAVERDPTIDSWLSGSDDLRSMARSWFARMRECGDDVRELMHDSCPVACVEDAPFGYVNVFKAHVNVGFYQGASLRDPAGLLEGSGKRMRHVKLKPGSELDTSALDALITAAYVDIKVRLEVERVNGEDCPTGR